MPAQEEVWEVLVVGVVRGQATVGESCSVRIRTHTRGLQCTAGFSVLAHVLN